MTTYQGKRPDQVRASEMFMMVAVVAIVLVIVVAILS